MIGSASQQHEWKYLAAKEQSRHGQNRAGSGQTLGGIFPEAAPGLTVGMIHPAGGQIGCVEQAGLKTGAAEDTGKLDPVVK